MEIDRVAADRLLTCTRSVRRRLDMSRPVDLVVLREIAELLGLPDHIGQGGMAAATHTPGDTFRPARRPPLDQVVRLDRWQVDSSD